MSSYKLLVLIKNTQLTLESMFWGKQTGSRREKKDYFTLFIFFFISVLDLQLVGVVLVCFAITLQMSCLSKLD